MPVFRPHTSLKAKTPISRIGLKGDNVLRLHSSKPDRSEPDSHAERRNQREPGGWILYDPRHRAVGIMRQARLYFHGVLSS